ncbi:putative drug exporter of the RND superfamily [Paenibacillus sophorae]|uniref:MMPL family transporter n=1 Tax=Paenibacillus sophorae TaxID=1333845 RepID=A0A1H8IIU8_9BACL|nr:MMPL family transporter [Paenibacillus sophorae]QWU15959.1 MMPL family transporter [Paenibacillus sophorae]SEN67668.1 putative drug exporter of the RND superfamily [Paenibacillus sophorae]
MEGYGKWVSGRIGRWVTLAVWILAVGVLSAAWPGVNSQVVNNAANLPLDAGSVQAEKLAQQEFPSGGGIPALLVWHRQGGISAEDLVHIGAVYTALEKKPLPHLLSVPPLGQLPPAALQAQLSKDGSTLVTPLIFDKAADSDQLGDSVAQLKEAVKAETGRDLSAADLASGDLTLRVSGPVGISIDAVGLFKDADVSLLIATVILVLVFLLLIYRSPLLALIPLVAVGFAYGAASPLLGKLAQEGIIIVDSQAVSIMTVLLFGAGTDYCLFLIARFRQLLKEERSPGRALLQAITGTSGAIAMSGFTVVLALLALLLAKFGAYHRFAVPFSLSILIMALASLTLVPALLAIFGRGSFYPFIPRTAEMEKERAAAKGKPDPRQKISRKGKIGRLVVTRPWAVVGAALIGLGVLASSSGGIRFTYDLLSSFPKDMESRQGFDLIGSQFTPGGLAPVTLMADTEGKAAAADMKSVLSSLSYVDSVSDPQSGAVNGNIKSYEIQFKVNPYSRAAMDYIPALRATVEQALDDAGVTGPGNKVWIGGQTAEQYDNRKVGNRDMDLIIPVVIGMIALLLLLYLRSVTAMLYLVATVILSFFSALGLGWLILHDLLGVDAIQGAIPLYSFVFLVALGEDYNIFMISNIWKKSRTMPLKQAVSEGVSETGAVITSAGLILAGTFAVLATLPIQVLVQFGVITALGVLLDTFVVRPFLVPAITVLLGQLSFWPGSCPKIPETQSGGDD